MLVSALLWLIMKQITGKIYCHLSREDQERYSITDIRASHALEVSTFSDLVKHIAYISYHNPEYALFFRAQSMDYKNSEDYSTIFPSIYRIASSKGYSRKTIQSRFSVLKQAEEELLSDFRKNRFLGVSKLTKYREMRWAILQHYKVCATPLLDVTHSLRVACSFALHKPSQDPYIFVLGLPHPNGSISFYVEQELLNVRLLSICPPRALRPYFQEGYLIGSFPSQEDTINYQYNFAKRLVAKFRLNLDTFIDKNFRPIPHSTLFPLDDTIKKKCDQIKSVLGIT